MAIKGKGGEAIIGYKKVYIFTGVIRCLQLMILCTMVSL